MEVILTENFKNSKNIKFRVSKRQSFSESGKLTNLFYLQFKYEEDSGWYHCLMVKDKSGLSPKFYDTYNRACENLQKLVKI